VKRLAQLVGIASLSLAGVLGVNTARRRSPPAVAVPAPPIDTIDTAAIAAHLGAALRFKTISHQDPADDDPVALAGLRSFFETTYPRTHATLQHELVNGGALLFTWQGSNPAAAPILFMAHQDVVPVEPGTEDKWTHPPFDGVVADGFVWGRGAMDDKGSLICLFEAIEAEVAKGWKPARTIYLESGSDEEVGGHEGSKKVAELLKSRGVKLAWVLDEGSTVTRGVIPGVDRTIAPIAITEKGYLTVELVAHTEGGHSAMPPAQTAIGVLAAAIDRLEKNQMPTRMLPFVRAMLETVAPEMPIGRRVMLSNLWLTESLVVHGMAGDRTTNATVRTTTAPTMLSAGVKENVLPSTARGVVNFRLLPGDTLAGVMRHVNETIADERVTATKLDRIASEAPPLSSMDGAGWAAVEKSIHRFFPDAIVVPGMVTGATDSRHFAEISTDVYRFTPRVVTKDDLKRIHGTDERFGVQDLGTAVRAYEQMLEDGAGK
jgi:carboxypeptidase PM20D1